jgi:DNA-binding transcriptional ArsR family regulator/DNA-directed RNA polymerase subunit RPC12/RpoP
MSETSPPHYSASEALQVLADPTRLDIVRTLGAAPPHGQPSDLTFSELRDRVGVEDSGRFTYHLDKLRDTFVEQGDAGYRLTYAGYTVYRLLVRGIFEAHDPLEPTPTWHPCVDCGGHLTVAHQGTGMVDVDCPDCGRNYLHYDFPPRSVTVRADDPNDLCDAVEAWVRRQIALFDRGVCPWCAGPVDATLTIDADTLPHDVDGDNPAYLAYVCTECGDGASLAAEYGVLSHPALAGFLHDHGIDHRDVPMWELRERMTVVVADDEPARVSVRVEVDGDLLVLEVDGDGDVVDTRRATVDA